MNKEELVICRVIEVHPNSVDVEIIEEGVEKKAGIIPITEISRAWIRDVKKFIKKGDLVVARVVSTEGTFVTLSLRKVSDFEKERKMKEYRDEIAAKRILMNIAKEAKVNYEKIEKKLKEEFGSLTEALKSLEKNLDEFEKLNLPKNFLELLHKKVCSERKRYLIKGLLEIHTFEPDGIDEIKKALKKLKNVEVKYTSPKFMLVFQTTDPKKGKKYLVKKMEEIINEFKRHGGFGSYELLE